MKKKRILGILLSLALVLGLMPGMSLTAYAATYSSDVQFSNLAVGDILENGVTISFSDYVEVYHDGNMIYYPQNWTTDKKYTVTEKKWTL